MKPIYGSGTRTGTESSGLYAKADGETFILLKVF